MPSFILIQKHSHMIASEAKERVGITFDFSASGNETVCFTPGELISVQELPM